MQGYEEAKIFMMAGMQGLSAMMRRGHYECSPGPKARKAKKAKRRQQKQGRRNSRH